MKLQKLHILLIIVIAFLGGYWVGMTKISVDWKNYTPHISFINKEPPASNKQVDLSLFWQVLNRLETTYYDKSAIDSKKILYGAISGMVESLNDPYTTFLPPTQNTDFKQGLAGQFEGIGAELGMNGKQIIIVSPLDGSPAQKAGIKPQDAILKVNDQPTFGWTMGQAVDKIRGPKGTDVTLNILHKGSDKSQDISITRDTITVKSVVGWVKQIKDIDTVKIPGRLEEVAYIRLSQFGDNSNQEWTTVVNDIYSKIAGNKNLKGIIFDLRNNPGGYLTDATFIASEFLRDGTVVIQDNGNDDKTYFSVNRKGVFLDVPLIVLINKGSASASEIVAGALHDHNRAKLLGETSFGKGTIQRAEDLGNNGGLHVTIAKWLTPNGTWVHGKGITPDIVVEQSSNNKDTDEQLAKAVQELIK